MLDVPEEMLEVLHGSVVGARMEWFGLYDGAFTNNGEALPVSSWSWDRTLGEQTVVQGKGSLTVKDPNGELAPWGYDEALSVAGSRLRPVFSIPGQGDSDTTRVELPLGEFLITDNTPDEMWRYGREGLEWVSGGASVPVTFADAATQALADDRFISPESPPTNATVFSELARLCGSSGVGVVYQDGISDRTVPSNMVYHEERVNAVYDIAGMVGAVRVTGDGALELYNPAKTAPVWVIEPALYAGSQIKVLRAQSRDSLYNAVVATSTSADVEIRQYAVRDWGPLRFDGPMGRRPMFKNSLAETAAGVFADAESTLDGMVMAATTTLTVHAPFHPGLQLGDWVRVAQPVVEGQPFPLDGRVTGINVSGDASGVGEMKLSVECALADVEMVARHVRKHRGS